MREKKILQKDGCKWPTYTCTRWLDMTPSFIRSSAQPKWPHTFTTTLICCFITFFFLRITTVERSCWPSAHNAVTHPHGQVALHLRRFTDEWSPQYSTASPSGVRVHVRTSAELRQAVSRAAAPIPPRSPAPCRRPRLKMAIGPARSGTAQARGRHGPTCSRAMP